MNTDVQKIVGVLENYQDYVNESNAEGLGSLYAQDAILFPDRFDTFESAENIAGFYAYAFSMLTLNLEFNIDPEKIIVANDIAYATTNSTGTRYLKEQDQTVPEINRELWAFQKIGEEWKISRYCFNKSE